MLEALSLTDINLLYDVCFNKDVGMDSCIYFSSVEDLIRIFNDYKELEKKKDKMGKMAKDIIENNFTWDIIVDKYKKIFK